MTPATKTRLFHWTALLAVAWAAIVLVRGGR